MTAYSGIDALTSGLARHEIRQKLRKECEADIVIGVPTLNHAATIGPLLATVQAGLTSYFPDLKAVVMASDAGSVDRTLIIARNSAVRKIPVYISRAGREPLFASLDPFRGHAGLGHSLSPILEAAEELNVRACAVLDADITSITPAWIERLLRPVLEKRCDHVSGLYVRNNTGSLLSETMLYPLVRALYGKQVRQPLSGNFCLSGKLARFHLDRIRREQGPALYAAELKLLSDAIANDFAVAEVFLGPRLRSRSSRPGLSSLLPKIMDTAFGLIEADHDVWKKVRGSSPVPLFGSVKTAMQEDGKADFEAMLAVFRQGVKDLKNVWTRVIGAEDVCLLEYLASRSEGPFHITPFCWARIVYDYALAYRRKAVSTTHLLSSFTPLYLGYAASHLIGTADSSSGNEDRSEQVCLAFEEGKDHLIRSWRAV